MNYDSLFDLEKWKEALEILLDPNGIPLAIWETFYVTLLSTFLHLSSDCLWAFCWLQATKTACCPFLVP